MSFFEQLNFSSSNEDGRTELIALSSTPRQRLLCLTGSGSRALDMLLGHPAELIALDINPFQNQLLRLKIAAFRTLNDTEIYEYLGLNPSLQRRRLHKRVERALPISSQRFWSRHQRLIDRGVWYAGRWEKVLRAGAKVIRLVRGKDIDRLFMAATLSDQAATWTAKFDDRIWRTTLRLLGRPWFWTQIIGEPGGAFLPDSKSVEIRIADAFKNASTRFHFRASDFASLILRGLHELPFAVPLHLQPSQTDIVRQSLDRISIFEGGLIDLPKLEISNVDGFSLSDFGSYCTPATYEKCWAGVAAAAAPGALVCEREFMNALPRSPLVDWNDALSRELTVQDKSFIYKIRAGAFR